MASGRGEDVQSPEPEGGWMDLATARALSLNVQARELRRLDSARAKASSTRACVCGLDRRRRLQLPAAERQLLLAPLLHSLTPRHHYHHYYYRHLPPRIHAMSSWWGSDPFADLVAKATSELLPAGQEDIALNLEICDKVRAKQVAPKAAMQVIKKRISDANPNVVLLALGLTDICIKNGGDHFLEEVASREFMDNLASVLKKPSGVNHDVKAKALSLIQDWAQVAEAKPAQMGYITHVYRSLKLEGFDFPAASNAPASAAFVETLTAPEWIDGDVCMRCRAAFTTFNRKHHCRNCGNVFCQQCSSHNKSLPWYGVGQDVRVCDGCYNKRAPPKLPAAGKPLQRSSTTIVPTGRGGAAAAQRSNTMGAKASGSSSRRSKREDDDLALAIKLSLQDNPQASSSSASAPSQPRATRQPNGRMLEGTDADDDPDLAAAIAASLRDYAPPQPSAPDDLPGPSPALAPVSASSSSEPQLPLPPSLDLPARDVDSILTFSQSVAAKDAEARHYGVSHPPDHQTQSLYDRATSARPKMARSLDEAGRRHGVLMSMHDKLTEAVRLYDRLLDAQMARPAGAYGYGAAPAGLQPPGSPDPFPRQHYAAHPQYYQQQQQYAAAPSEAPPHHQPYQSQPAYGYSHAGAASYGQQQQAPPQHHPQSPSAMTNGSAAPSLYPSFPPPASMQHQEPQLTGASSQHAYGAGVPPLSPSASTHGAYNAPHQQAQMAAQQQQQGYYAPPHDQQPQQQQPGQPHPGYPSATPAQPHAATTPSAGPAAGLSHFEQLMSPSPSTSSHAPPPGTDRRASAAHQEPTAGIGAHGQGQQQADPAHAGSAPSSSLDAPVANGKMFPSVPTNDFAAPSSPWAQQHQQQQPYYQPQQQPQQQMVAEAPALIDL